MNSHHNCKRGIPSALFVLSEAYTRVHGIVGYIRKSLTQSLMIGRGRSVSFADKLKEVDRSSSKQVLKLLLIPGKL